MKVKFLGAFVYAQAGDLLLKIPLEKGERFSVEGEIDVSPSEDEEGPPAAPVRDHRQEPRFPEHTPNRWGRDYGLTVGRTHRGGWVPRKPGAE